MLILFCIDPSLFIFAAILLLLVPGHWLFASISAAIVHEAFHAAAIYLTGGKITRIKIGIGGTVIETQLQCELSELLCAAAGPAGSFLLILFSRIYPRLAICGMIQGSFNLIPVLPMDGGRILKSLLNLMIPDKSAQILRIVEKTAIFILAITALYGCFHNSVGLLPAILLTLFLTKRKNPCKQS